MVRPSLPLLLLLTASACGTAVLGTPPLEAPGSTGSLQWEAPYETYPFDAAEFGAVVHPILVRDGCANAGCHAFEDKAGEGLWINENAVEGSSSMHTDLLSVLTVVDLSLPAAQNRLIYHPVASSRSHAGRTPWWGLSASETAPYAPIMDWLEGASSTTDCYEAAFEIAELESVEAAVSAAGECSPAPAQECWPDC